MMKEIKKDDYMATVGFYGHTLIVDAQLKKKIKNKNVSQLLEDGYYKEAVSSASFSGSEDEQQEIIEFFKSRQYVENFNSLKREFGIYEGLEKITKIKKI